MSLICKKKGIIFPLIIVYNYYYGRQLTVMINDFWQGNTHHSHLLFLPSWVILSLRTWNIKHDWTYNIICPSVQNTVHFLQYFLILPTPVVFFPFCFWAVFFFVCLFFWFFSIYKTFVFLSPAIWNRKQQFQTNGKVVLYYHNSLDHKYIHLS